MHNEESHQSLRFKFLVELAHLETVMMLDKMNRKIVVILLTELFQSLLRWLFMY